MSVSTDAASPTAPFVHEAFFYADDEEYLAGMVPFIEAGLELGEPILVAVPEPRLSQLEARFTPYDRDQLLITPMEAMGRNPGWIIPAWAEFVGRHATAGRNARGIGEPIWFGRGPDELVECGRHEALLNHAFRDATGFQLVCPYNTSNLESWVIDEAHRNHPHIGRPGLKVASARYEDQIPPVLTTPLPPAPDDAQVIDFDRSRVGAVRRQVARAAADAGVAPAKTDDLVLAVSEAVTNSVHHGGGSGRVTVWREGTRFLCEIRDQGVISDPLAGRKRPGLNQSAGRGLWLMNQLCDLMQIRQLPEGQVIRLHLLP
jgi:anti-sigma regulatory factor (Ser/Thr protein kinase)